MVKQLILQLLKQLNLLQQQLPKHQYNNQCNRHKLHQHNKQVQLKLTTLQQNTYSAPVTTGSSSEEAAKAWIAGRESGGSYTATNGNYYGKYQLSRAYLNGDYSAANQERVANQYVQARYGSWSAAKAHWLSNGWY